MIKVNARARETDMGGKTVVMLVGPAKKKDAEMALASQVIAVAAEADGKSSRSMPFMPLRKFNAMIGSMFSREAVLAALGDDAMIGDEFIWWPAAR